jgi:disulfide bond formation protein DsbB
MHAQRGYCVFFQFRSGRIDSGPLPSPKAGLTTVTGIFESYHGETSEHKGGEHVSRRLCLVVVATLVLALALSACGGSEGEAPPEPTAPTGDAAKGREIYAQTCAGCHGPNGEGGEGPGKAWTTSAFIRDSSNDELLNFIKVGRPIGDPANTTNVDMPPKGGNPTLTDQDLQNIIAFMRALQ